MSRRGVGQAAYRLLLRLLPLDFRRRHGPELLDAFDRVTAEEKATGGKPGRRALRECADLLRIVLVKRLRWERSRRPSRRGSGTRAHFGSWTDCTQAFRSLRRAPGHSFMVLLTISLGTGAAGAIFTVAQAVWLHPLPYEASQELVYLRTSYHGRGASVSREDLTDLSRSPSLAATAAFHYGARIVEMEGVPVRLVAYAVDIGLFDVLGVKPARGRSFTEADIRADAPPVVVVSDRFWRTRLNSDPDAVGRTLQVLGGSATIIGVMPEGFEFPQALPSQMWGPLDPGEGAGQPRSDRNLQAVARLAPGWSLSRAENDIQEIAKRLQVSFPGTNQGWGVQLLSVVEATVGRYRTAFAALLGMVGLLLAIAGANIAGLMLARQARRRVDLTLRWALGGGAGRVRWYLLSEGILPALAGIPFGVLFAWVGAQGLVALMPGRIPGLQDPTPNGLVVTAIAGACLAIGLVSGLAPLFLKFGTGRDEAGVLRGGARGIGSGGGGRVRDGLVVGQVALALVLLASAGLMGRAFARLVSLDLGFDPKGVLTLHATALSERYRSDDATVEFWHRAEEALLRNPSIQDVGMVTGYPGSGMGLMGVGPVGDGPATYVRLCDGTYFRAMRTPLLRGRTFEASDRSDVPSVAIVNETLAHSLWPGLNPIGRTVPLPAGMGWIAPEGHPLEVVGVVGDMRLEGAAAPDLFLPTDQAPPRWMDMVIRTSGDPTRLAEDVRRTLRALEPDLLIEDVQPFSRILGARRTVARIQSTLAVAFGILATLLSAIGLYGLLSTVVAQRLPEMSVRRALGAGTRDTFGRLVTRGLVLTGIGLAFGGLVAFALLSALREKVFGLEDIDPAVLLLAGLLLTGVGLAASLGPARRAVRADPVDALRGP